MGIIKDSTTNEIIEHIFYRQYCSKFGCLSDSINHEQESKIAQLLAEKNYGPKIFMKKKIFLAFLNLLLILSLFQ